MLAILGGLIVLWQFLSKEEPQVVAQCREIPAHASLDPLYKRDLDVQVEIPHAALNEAIAQETWPQSQKESLLRNVERIKRNKSLEASRNSNSWIKYGYVACEIHNSGAKIARDVSLNVSQDGEFAFYDGTTLSASRPGELKLGDMRPGTRRNIEFFISSNTLTIVGHPDMHL